MSKKKESSEMNERMEGEYEDAKERQRVTRNYYSSRPKTFDTMLGGYTQVHDADIQESNQLLQSLFKQYNGKLGSSHCLELGCGIGRVTKNLLSNYFEHIDINDLLEEYCQQTRTLFENDENKIDQSFVCSIGDLELNKFPKYDLIWAQWVLGYLDGDDLVSLLRKLKLTLKKNGLIVIKDNCVGNGQEPEFDPDDQYYVRSGEQFYDIAHRAGFILVKDQSSKLKKVVRELLPIRIFVLALK
ncbi:unnamed protein product [Rotaria sordida]|uniref:Alpha N-terminal protein methyltransferase 1 n=1 Tax=Rotaria sordida TaxID=392033 RepID=A0A814L373_9BILA|nr:unnamed protein product [Rotaria sordida]CAF0968159.1 unnamed protein product [Rotaria sordida]CAF1059355.1 unnamed protein product [Rotaria sordida]CAF1066976.1 unnamed protein product [Rotaria sordida]CAF1129829.1 unnamed protein product [Rotaria sordida]